MMEQIATMGTQMLLGGYEVGRQMKAIAAQNKAVMADLGKQINQINLQRTALRQQTAQALFNIDVASTQAQSQIQLQAAASGTMGASVNDAVSTVNVATDRQTTATKLQEQQQEEAIRMQVESAVTGAHNNMNWKSGSDMVFDKMLSIMSSAAGDATASAFASTATTDTSTPSNNQSSTASQFKTNSWAQSWNDYLKL